MERTKKMLIIGITAIIIGSLLMLPSEKPENENITADRLSSEGMNSRNPVILDFNGTFHTFWVGVVSEDGREAYRILHSVLKASSWSVGSIITHEDIHPGSLSGLAYKNMGILSFTERGGVGSIYVMKSMDSGNSWSEPSFLIRGEYPEFWMNGGISMLAYDMSEGRHIVVRFDTNKTVMTAVNESIALPPKIIPVNFTGMAGIFFVKNGGICYSSFEKNFALTTYTSVLPWENVTEIHPIVKKETAYVLFSSFEPGKNRLRIWEIHSLDMKNWSVPVLVGDAVAGSSFSASVWNENIFVAWSSGNFTHIKIIDDNAGGLEIGPAGDEYFFLGKVVAYSSGEISKKAIYVYVID